MSFLDDLYYGNIKPVDNEFVKNSEFDKALKIFCDCETELRKAIDKDADEALTKLINSHNELLATTGLENFKIGSGLGVKMMCNTFIDKNDSFKDVTGAKKYSKYRYVYEINLEKILISLFLMNFCAETINLPVQISHFLIEYEFYGHCWLPSFEKVL